VTFRPGLDEQVRGLARAYWCRGWPPATDDDDAAIELDHRLERVILTLAELVIPSLQLETLGVDLEVLRIKAAIAGGRAKPQACDCGANASADTMGHAQTMRPCANGGGSALTELSIRGGGLRSCLNCWQISARQCRHGETSRRLN
jgi:hypothetical protein